MRPEGTFRFLSGLLSDPGQGSRPHPFLWAPCVTAPDTGTEHCPGEEHPGARLLCWEFLESFLRWLRFPSAKMAPMRIARRLAAAASILLLAVSAGCSAEPTTGLTPAASDAAPRVHLRALAEDIGAREPGTAEEARAAAYVRGALEGYGYATQTQEFTFSRRGKSSANIIATHQGTSPREIVIGAHYDSGPEGAGADDNASGVAALLTLAERLRDETTPLTITMVAFGAEEADDMHGSAHYVDELSSDELDNIVAMVNIDSIAAGEFPYVYGDADPLKGWIMNEALSLGTELRTVSTDRLHNDADYVAFMGAGVSFVYFEATNWELGDRDGFTQVDPRYGRNGAIMHTRYDTLSYLDATFPGRVDAHLALYIALLERIATEYAG